MRGAAEGPDAGGFATFSRSVPNEPEGSLDALFERYPAMDFERGTTLIENTLLETTDFSGPPVEGAVPSSSRSSSSSSSSPAMVGYVVEGLVQGVWNRNTLAPENRSTAIVAGDARWVGVDAFKFAKNLFRYVAMTPTKASIVPLAYILEDAPRPVLLSALRSVSLDWCTTASVLSLSGESLHRRTLLLLYDLSRLHPRPELEVRQKDIADLLGVARQTLQPVLKRLESRGLVTLGYAEIVIGDPRVLVQELRRKRAPLRPHGGR